LIVIIGIRIKDRQKGTKKIYLKKIKGKETFMKKWMIPAMLISFLSLSVLSPAEAGERSRHRWQGIAIGAASYMVLDHLFNRPAGYGYSQPAYVYPAPTVIYEYRPAPPPCYPPETRHYRKQYYSERQMESGYWESVWIPGHYDRSGRYIDGHYERYYVED